MLGTMALVLVGFVFLIARSFRRARQDGGYRPEGKLRWTEPS